MKIILTGSLGHIGKPLTEELVQKGHAVTVISSNPARQNEIEALGATAAIGSVEDAAFLTAIFTGADAVYTMVPPANFFDKNLDLAAHCQKLADNYAEAIIKSGIKRVVHLSSIGAHLEKGSGLILLHRAVEVTLDKLSGVDITFMRPVGFYYNLLGFIPVIKNAGIIASNYGADDNLVWVSPIDIAEAVAEELETPLNGRKIRYVASDEITGNETATILGEAIGVPDLKWVLISDEQLQSNLETAGLNPAIAAGLVEMFASQHKGLLNEDYYRNRPAELGKVKTTDFAKEFAAVYNQK
ncbi:NAD(P)H-binding protein [Mucilaginibacter sp. BJC16-A38]|uniref:NAD(P)H-binding protein n=1 Tax=Mucilaginibacter phenanthrenivorans TaxID=1234842 RepID=UPI0021579787|nr:NAD(P)H-binding protein [Mucilaginibacter phenanthrenivorans]MCR8558975.1 NAD(P)H-binding protein [Mucilaginibacter phenanthrenivorans]